MINCDGSIILGIVILLPVGVIIWGGAILIIAFVIETVADLIDGWKYRKIERWKQ